ncbi:DUF4360 domain-containing protein [Pilimelia columellifera]
MGYLRIKVLVAAAGAIAMLGTAAVANAAPLQKESVIEGVSFKGTGCEKGTAQSNLSNGDKTMTVIYDAYEVRLEPAVADKPKSCEISVRLRAAKGTQYAVRQIVQSGYADVGSGMTGTLHTKYYYPGEQGRPDLRIHEKTESYDAGYADLVTNVLPREDYWTPCGLNKKLILQSSIALSHKPGSSKDGVGYMALDTTEADIKLELKTRTCSKK